ncbi:hypothetical protein [Coralliovum pocilloporae]|uniref:hypothetical protein n=1 Tax=Coralliovum pocilloporae TaxID=3066369 RepID=UPI0033075348
MKRRFRYWTGFSGRRYLFSVIQPDELRDYEDGVVLLTQNRGEEERHVLWTGTIGDETLSSLIDQAEEAFIHLLAANDEERNRIAQDLTHKLSAV